MLSTSRGGFSIIELVVMVLIVGILAAIAVPSYQQIVYRARASKIVNDLRVVRTAAHQYEIETGRWDNDQAPGRFPYHMRPYMMDVEFSGRGYQLDWDNWGYVVGVSVIVDDVILEASLLNAAGDLLQQVSDHRYLYVIATPRTP